ALLNQLVNIHCAPVFLAFAVGTVKPVQTPNNFRSVGRRGPDRLETLMHFCRVMAQMVILEKHVAVALDDRERIVEVMRDSASHCAELAQTLLLNYLLLNLL